MPTLKNIRIRGFRSIKEMTIERVCRQAGYEPPIICTPNELMDPGTHP